MSTQTYWTSSSILLRETCINGFFINTEPIRIGAGREPPLGATVELAVLRIPYGDYNIPYIPGSSLKGVFRSHATKILRSNGIKVCTGLSKETCVDLKEVGDPELGRDKLGKVIELKLRGAKSFEAMEIFWKHACLMCKIFGSPSYLGKISFGDAYPLDEQRKILPLRIGTRTGIAIDRRTGAVMSGAIYTVEYVEPGASFRFDIRCTNLPNYALGLLAMILRMVANGEVKVGGFKSRGFGRLKIEQLRFRNRDFSNNPILEMKSLEEGVDKGASADGLATLKDGWLVAQDDDAWRLLEKLEEVWNGVIPKIRSS